MIDMKKKEELGFEDSASRQLAASTYQGFKEDGTKLLQHFKWHHLDVIHSRAEQPTPAITSFKLEQLRPRNQPLQTGKF